MARRPEVTPPPPPRRALRSRLTLDRLAAQLLNEVTRDPVGAHETLKNFIIWDRIVFLSTGLAVGMAVVATLNRLFG